MLDVNYKGMRLEFHQFEAAEKELNSSQKSGYMVHRFVGAERMPQGESLLMEDPDHAEDLKEEFTRLEDRYEHKVAQRA